MTSLFSDILNISLTSSVLLLAITLIRAFLKKAPKFYFCLLWGIAGLRLILPFSFENTYSPIPSYDTVEQTFYNISEVEESTIYLGEIFTWVWFAGMILMALYGIISYIRIRVRVLPSIKLQKNVYLCDGIDSPFILGTFRPRIYIPSDLDTSRIDDVLRHEKAHLSRGDHFWKPLGYIILTLHWFNPVVWIAYMLLCRDIEKACDEKVISKMGSAAKMDYLESLVVCSVHRKRLALCPVAFGEIGVKARVKLILNYKRPSLKLLAFCLLIGTFVVFFLFTSSNDTYFDVYNENMETARYEKDIDYSKLDQITPINLGNGIKDNINSGSNVIENFKPQEVKQKTSVGNVSSTTSSNSTTNSIGYNYFGVTTTNQSSVKNASSIYTSNTPKSITQQTVTAYNRQLDYVNRINTTSMFNQNNGVIQIFP